MDLNLLVRPICLYYVGGVAILFVVTSLLEAEVQTLRIRSLQCFSPSLRSGRRAYLKTTCPKFDIPIESISYCSKKPYLIVFRGHSEKHLKPFLKQFEIDLKDLSPLHPWNVYITGADHLDVARRLLALLVMIDG
ncbi:MAG: hypothetical protein MZU97_03840 [Bacillus subtilis]|nr:hypothetical protein [Bacillus subtilis]